MATKIRFIVLYVGNAGGYLGLFLGYALLNVPELLHAAYKWAVQKFFKDKNSLTLENSMALSISSQE